MALVDIYHWWQLDDRVTTSGQPTEAELAALAQAGVRRVINVAPHSHARGIAYRGAYRPDTTPNNSPSIETRPRHPAIFVGVWPAAG